MGISNFKPQHMYNHLHFWKESATDSLASGKAVVLQFVISYIRLLADDIKLCKAVSKSKLSIVPSVLLSRMS